MKYPKFLNVNDTIGICALSAGVGHKIEDYIKSIDFLKSKGFNIKECGNVRSNNIVSESPTKRAESLNNLYLDKEVDFIMCATGGEFLIDILPFIDEKIIVSNPKFFMGYSDPTSINILLTTKYDIASIYGFNAGSYEAGVDFYEKNIEIIKGNLITQKSYQFYKNYDSNNYDKTIFVKNDLNIKGRCIGGCLDVIRNIIATPYENIKGFIEKYKNDGIVWYFDIYDISAEEVYRILMQMKYAGYFDYCNGILFGRVLFESNSGFMNYNDAYKSALGDIKYAYDFDIGHTSPKTTLINGAIINVEVLNGKSKIDFILE